MRDPRRLGSGGWVMRGQRAIDAIGMRARSLGWLVALTTWLGCAVYDPDLLPAGRSDASDVDAGDEDASGPDAGADSGLGECRVLPDAACPLVCVERCNNLDDDCDGVIDNNGAGLSCDIPNAEAACAAGECFLVGCTGDYADCNEDPDDGCEALLTSPQHCGLCGATCTFPNAIARCEAGQCVLGDCEPGFDDCDGQPANGCETSLRTLGNCGACHTTCAIDGAVASCQTGTCQLAGCALGFQDCNDDGICESQASDPSNCGTCGNVCTGSTLNCSGGRCRLTACPDGEADCDDNDVCEPLNTASNCRSCGVGCPLDLPNGTGSCGTGVCTATCNAGFADCDGDVVNGCETDLRTLGNCGACGMTCGGVQACNNGTCVDLCPRTYATPGSTRAATRKIKNLTGSGASSAQFGVGGTDLGIPIRQPDGKTAYIFADTYDQDTVGGPGWRSPVLLRSEPGLDPAGIVFTSAAGGQYAKQLLDYSHAGGVSWIPSDVITVGSRMYLHYIVGGFANVQWTQIAYSDDNGENWTVSNARWEANENNSLQQLWTWERGCDGYVYVMSTRFSRDRGIIMHRVPETSLLDKSAYQPWGFRDNQWAWGNPASVILDGQFGELSLRRVESRWVLAWFNAGAYEITIKVFNSPTSNLYTANTYSPIRGGAWGAENNTTVAQLFGAYIHPDSTLHNLHLMVSQWNTNTNWPYRVMQFVTGVE